MPSGGEGIDLGLFFEGLQADVFLCGVYHVIGLGFEGDYLFAFQNS